MAGVYDLAQADRGFEPELFVKFMLSKGIDVRRDLCRCKCTTIPATAESIDTEAQTNIAGCPCSR